MLNGLALLFVGIYTGAVVMHGNLNPLFDAMAEDREFIKWAAALGIIMAISNTMALGPLGKGIASLAIAGLAFNITRDVDFKNLMALIKGDTATSPNHRR